jgi:dihydropteroate synthase
MGVLNVTPDSFSDGGRYLDPELAAAHGLALVAEGADVVDVGGESTRPGAGPVDEAEERRRVVPVIEALAPSVRVSVDTRSAAVAEAAVAAGATLVNDVSASLWPAAAEVGAGWVAMHMRGEPVTMQEAPRYDDVVAEVGAFLQERAAQARAAGVEEVWIDPGIGFGKTLDHNLALLAGLSLFHGLGAPLLLGASRKRIIGSITGKRDPKERVPGSLAVALAGAAQAVQILRVHDVDATRQALDVWRAAVLGHGG